MKKIIVIVGLTISFTLIGIGILGFTLKTINTGNKEEVKELTIEEMKKQLEQGILKIKNAKNLTLETSFVGETEEESTSSVLKVNLDTMESEVSMTMMGQEFVHSYTVLEEEKFVSYSYSPMMGQSWLKSINGESGLTYNDDYLDILMQYQDTLVKHTDYVWQLTIPKEDAVKLLNNDEKEDASDEQTEVSEEIVADVVIRLIVSEGNIQTIQIDFSNTIKRGEQVLTKYTISNNYKDVGTTVITVPEDIKNNAVDSEDLL